MTVRIGSNLDALRSQRSLGQASDRIGQVYQRLSTGQRINRASDDAAGLSIADALTAKSRVFTRGAQNVSDGISALTIADSAVEALIQLTTRIQELAEQGASGSYSPKQRLALDNEAQTLRNEFFRIVQSTSFNGQRLLDGTVQGLQIQAGYGTEGAIASSVGGKLGAGSFEDVQSHAVGGRAADLATGDLNGDGFQDIVTANSSSNRVSVLLGNGDGTFRNPSNYVVGSSPSSVALSDFNRDGIQDIVTANSGSSSVSVLLGKGDGTFLSQTTLSVGATPSSVTTADFNGDGIPDIVTANGAGAGSTLTMRLGIGDGTFAAPSTLSGMDRPYAVTAGDLNGDGIQDLAVAGSDMFSGLVRILVGDGRGNFQVGGIFEIGDDPRDIVISDLDGDGTQDLVTASFTEGTATVLFGLGNGNYDRAHYSMGNSQRGLSIADLNGDGYQDLMTAASGSGGVIVRLGEPERSFGGTMRLEVESGSVYSVGVADLNGDGVQEVVAANFGTSSVEVFTAQTRDGIHPLLPISLKTQADSKEALSIVSKKLELLSAQRGVIGAAQSRLLSGSRTLLSQRDEFVSANSRIRDTDFAGEAAELTRTQIVQNTATAVLAQANLQPAIALQLLRS